MKNMLIILLWGIITNCFAQYKLPKKEVSEKVLQSKLAIQLADEKTETDKYANSCIKDIFQKNWNLTEVVFLTKDEINKIKNSGGTGYAILSQKDELKKDIRSGYCSSDGRMHRVGVGGPGTTKFDYTAFTFSHYDFKLSLINANKEIEVLRIGFANGELTSIDFLFLCQQLTRLIEYSSKSTNTKGYYNVDSNIVKCKNSTLILLKDFFKEKDQQEIKSNYEYEHKLVDRNEFQDIILNKNPNNPYVKIIWSDQHEMYMWIVVDAENGSIISQVGFGGIHFGVHHEASDIIKSKHLKYIYSKTAQNINNRYK